MLKITLAALLVTTLAFSEAHAGKVGWQFTVDAGLDSGDCDEPSVTGQPNDGFVVVYRCAFIYAGGGTNFFGKRYDSSAAVLARFLGVEVPYDGVQFPWVASDASGKFITSWGENTKTTGFNIIAKRFSATAGRLATQARVNTITAGDQIQPSVAILSDGGFVVVWRSHPPKGADGIYGRRYNAAGAPLGADFQINTQPALYSDAPSVAALSTGGFVVAWNSGAQLYNAAGKRVAGEFKFNKHVANQQIMPHVAALKNGAFEIVWLLKGQGVYGQRYNRLGKAFGNEIQITTISTANYPAIAGLSNGGFVVVWAQGSNPGGIFGQLYNMLGNPAGSSFQVNAPDVFLMSAVSQASVAGQSSGGFVVIWSSYSIVDGNVLNGQRFGP